MGVFFITLCINNCNVIMEVNVAHSLLEMELIKVAILRDFHLQIKFGSSTFINSLSFNQ